MKKKLKKPTFEETMDKFILKYQDILGLRNCHIGYDVDPEDRYLAMEFTYPYTSSTLFYSPRFKEQLEKNPDNPELERRVIHELCHRITDPLYAKAVSTFRTKDEVEDVREEVTDNIANIVFRLTR